MNQVTEESKSTLMKVFAVVGFVVLIVFGAWLAIRIISFVPSAFSSLASLADSVYNAPIQEDKLTITTTDSVKNSKESFVIAWADVKKNGVYTLTYVCVDGVSLDIRIPSGEIVPITCNAKYVLPTDTYSVDAVFASEKVRFADIVYSISFRKKGQNEPLYESTKILTVVNPSISQDVAQEDEDTVQETEIVIPEETTPKTEELETNTHPNTPVTQTKYIYTEVYTLPVSDPSGYTELAVAFKSIGILNNKERFSPRASLDTDDRGAFQFTVKNTGTKTSDTWKFEAEFTSGKTYTSKTQDPIKPNETITITIAFDTEGEAGTQKFGASITGGNDQSSKNNSFSWAVKVTD